MEVNSPVVDLLSKERRAYILTNNTGILRMNYAKRKPESLRPLMFGVDFSGLGYC